ncbi:MAG: c-type cytochrome biogenesis protein CcmI [Gammaproteobacteria bacterium]|nr:c-type cytochrome biogenesis protein CcmI [Gammaproteobacteria bacterium]
MLAFITTIALLILLALLFFVPALLKPKELEAETFDQQNIQIAKDRLAELKDDLGKGVIDQSAYELAKEELEKNLAMDLSVSQTTVPGEIQSSKGLAMVLMVAVPLVALLIYSQLGRYDSIDGSLHKQQVAEEGAPNMSIEDAIRKLEQRLQKEPENPEGWYMLARTYAATQQYNKAVPAYAKTVELVPDNADLLLSYADALAMSEGGRMSGKARPVIEQAMQINPDHMQGLWMSGMLSNELNDYKQALVHWYKLEPQLNNDIESQTQLRSMIVMAEQNLTPDVVEAMKQALQQAVPAVAAAEIKLRVSLDPQLKNKVNAGDTLFVFAKAMQGPPMPLAAVKKTADVLPLDVVLNDAMAMMPAMKLSNFEQVKVVALVSRSGQPGAQPGDLYGEVMSVDIDSTQTVNLIINTVK